MKIREYTNPILARLVPLKRAALLDLRSIGLLLVFTNMSERDISNVKYPGHLRTDKHISVIFLVALQYLCRRIAMVDDVEEPLLPHRLANMLRQFQTSCQGPCFG